MHIESLLRMANQVGAFFEAMPDRPLALEDAAMHLKRFWEPRMRQQLLAHVDGAGAPELSEFMREAIRTCRQQLCVETRRGH